MGNYRFLVNGEVSNRGDESEIKNRLKCLYKDELLEMALQYRFERDFNYEIIKKCKRALEMACEDYKNNSRPANYIYHITKEDYMKELLSRAEREVENE